MKHNLKIFLQKKNSIKKNNSLVLFAREIIANPRAMGAACPSTLLLARYMASQVPINHGNNIIVELGAGTGAVTIALLERGILPSQLVVIERSLHLVRYINQRFPQIPNIIHGDAANLQQLLTDNHLDSYQISSIVSSLPLRSLEISTKNSISKQFDSVLRAGNLLIQFTYNLRGTCCNFLPKFKCISSRIIWKNFPPARVEVFEKLAVKN